MWALQVREGAAKGAWNWFALDRDPFLLSVTGHADSHDASLEIADRFLANGEVSVGGPS